MTVDRGGRNFMLINESLAGRVFFRVLPELHKRLRSNDNMYRVLFL
jgi:hypothetical protein